MSNNLQDQITTATPTFTSESHHLAWSLATAADERKAEDIIILNVSEVSYLTEYFVIVTGFSTTQVRAIADSMEHKAETELQRVPLRTQGQSEGSWVVLDYGGVIAHILLPTERKYYNLEAFWGHGGRVDFQA